MTATEVSILVSMQDQATPQMANLGKVLTQNRAAFRELAMGVSMLGISFMSMGVALKQVNNPLVQTIGSTLTMAGAVMTAIGTTVQFISAISRTVDALKKLAVAEAVVKAFQGPAGWVTLGIGTAVAVGAVAGIKAMTKTENITINNHIQGSVVTDKQIAETVRKQVVLTQQRNATSGIM